MLLPWQQGSGGHPDFPLLRGSIRLGEHRLRRHQILTWTRAHTHTHALTLLLLNACSVFVCRGYRTTTREQLTLQRQMKFFRARCWLMPGGETVFCSVVDDSVHQKCNGYIHKWSSLKTELKTHYFSIMSWVVLALIRTLPLLCGGNITPSCILKPGSLLLPFLSAKAHTRQNVI